MHPLPTKGRKDVRHAERCISLNDRAQVRKSGRSFVCTTQDLVALNLKHKEAEQECLRITEKILGDLANFVKSRVIYLMQFSEALALLDVVVMLHLRRMNFFSAFLGAKICLKL